jgi:uncharacterized protein (DUF488 family)
MMYYRRKIILAILETFGGNVGKIHFQKLLLIFTQLQSKPAFDFVPHRYGCYSFQASWDLRALKYYNAVTEDEKFWQLKADGCVEQLKKEERSIISHICREYKSLTTREIVMHTYQKFPYYATRSVIASRMLNSEDMQKVQDQRPDNQGTKLFTIGYEGITLEKYLNKLLLNNVAVLCDIRRNPMSQKTGFNKSELKYACDSVGIDYVHIPQLGIASEKRKNLDNQKAYDVLFEDFRQNYLIHQQKYIEELFALLSKKQRIALTCFEASHCQCHRSEVANILLNLPNWNQQISHL